METRIIGTPVSKIIDYKYSQLTEPFIFYSSILNRKVIIPAGFIMDWESVPFFKGTSKIAGLIHDYLSRIDSDPIVTKKIAAKVYLEFMKFRKTSLIRRQTKYWVVRVVRGYFHKLIVGGA